MFYEFAITPEIFGAPFLTRNDAHPVILTQLLQGICENGMISDLNKSVWRKDIARRIGEVPSQKTKTDLMTLLSVLNDRNRLVRHPKVQDEPKGDLEWLKLARQAHERAPLDAIMISSKLLVLSGMTEELLVKMEEALDAPVWMARKRSETIRKQEEDYRGLLPKVLRHAKRLYLIDPYFRPDRRRWKDTIKICASLMGQRGGVPLQGIIEIHTGDPSDRRTPQEETQAWKQWKRAEFDRQYAHTLLVSMWRRRLDNGEPLHDRFLITDQVGFSIAGGLDCLREPFGVPADTIWTLMDEEDRQLWLRKFRVGTSPFEKVDV